MELSEFDIIEPSQNLTPYVRRYFYLNRVLDEPLAFDLYQSNSAYFVSFFSANKAGAEARPTVVIDDLKETIKTPWTLGGPILKSDVSVYAEHEMRMIVCEFTATAIYQLFGVNGEDLTDRRLELSDLSADISVLAQAHFLCDETHSEDDHVAEMNSFLTALTRSARSVDEAILEGIAILEACDGVIKISDLVADLNISERQFLRGFKSIVGMGPKKYGQVLQINWALKLMFLEGENAVLSTIAQEAGFSDQSHFIKVMKGIFKQSPAQFLESGHIEIEAFLKQDSHFEAIMALIPKFSKGDDSKS